MATKNSGWWDDAVGYDIFVPSFDGLAGVTAHLDHVAWLGVDLVALSPFFASSWRNDGYDLIDHRLIDSGMGTDDDFAALIDRARHLGIRVVVTLVANHTSIDHHWFAASASSLDDPRRGFYHWRPPGPRGGPPNNWVARSGGSAWSLDPGSGHYFLHLFAPDQPDLNWNNPGVVREFDDIIEVWLERGVDGFRVDTAHGLVKNMLMPDNPRRFPVTDDLSPRQVFAAFEHRYDLDQAGNTEIYRRWRSRLDRADAVLIGDVYTRESDHGALRRYVAAGDGLHRVFSFAPAHVPWNADTIWNTIRDALDAAPVDLAWGVSVRGEPRAATRFGGGERGRRRAVAFSMALAGLPALPVLHQGDELGYEPEDDVDGWVGIIEGIDRQAPASRSWAVATKVMLDARRLVLDVDAPIEWLTARGDDVVLFRRGAAIWALHTGVGPTDRPLPAGAWNVVCSTGPAVVADGRVRLDPDTAAILAR